MILMKILYLFLTILSLTILNWTWYQEIGILDKRDVYLFNGFRSLHGNQPVLEGHIRATLLLHFYDNFHNSKLVKLNRSYRKLIEDINIKKNTMNS